MHNARIMDLNFLRMTIKSQTLAVFILLLTACQGTNASSTPNVGIYDIQVTIVPGTPPSTMAPYNFKPTQSGTATLHGTLVVLDPTLLPAHDDAIYLVPISQDNAPVSVIPSFTKGQVPQADVDERTGEFMFTGINPGRYVVMVVTEGGGQLAARTMDQARNLVVVTVDNASLDKTTEIGTISMP